VSQSRDLQRHIAQLREIRSILNSMKDLAFMEVHKLARFQAAQGRAVANIERAALDFLDFYPGLSVEPTDAAHLYILVGSERGFCGDFNDSLINAVAAHAYSGLIAVGSRLINKGPDAMAAIEGASAAEEVSTVLNRLLDKISALPETHSLAAASRLTVVYHDSTTGQIIHRQILPPFPRQPQQAPHGYPPLLNLAPTDFYADLVHHYLLAVLHEIFYISLMTENQKRLQHLEGAVKHLDDEMPARHRKLQRYRQEEITEEIEVILLNTENL
jgi:F-type H+-transporting ATPase subunit gamma